MTKQNTAYLIIGFIGSGKTTFAKQLEKETGALRFTKDEWVIRIFGQDPAAIKEFEMYDHRITDLVTDIAVYCLQAGKDVIIDDGFWFKSQRIKLKHRIEKIGAKAQFYYIKSSKDKMKQRVLHRNNNVSKDAFKISEGMFNHYKKKFEEPSLEEDYTSINN